MAWGRAAVLVSVAAAFSLACLATYRHQVQEAQQELATQVREREALQQVHQHPERRVYDEEALALVELPWPQALTAVEQVRPVGVRVAEIVMMASTRSLQLEVELSGQVSLASYLQRLNAATIAWEWVPVTTSIRDAHGRSAVIIARLRGRVPTASP